MTKYFSLFLALREEFEAAEWAAAYGTDVAAMWRESPRGDWSIQLALFVGIDKRIIVLATCDCVEHALPYVPQIGTLPTFCIKVTRKWARGEATSEAMRGAQDAASFAVDDIDECDIGVRGRCFSIGDASASAGQIARAEYAIVRAVKAICGDGESLDHVATHAKMADIVRSRISTEAVVAAYRSLHEC